MNLKNILYNFILASFVVGCNFAPAKSIKVAGDYAYPEQGQNQKIYQLILQLTSPHFFEYTQAARKLITQGKESIHVLYKYRELTREVDGSNVFVCPPVIKIILQELKIEWLKAQKDKISPKLWKMIEQELRIREKAAKITKTYRNK